MHRMIPAYLIVVLPVLVLVSPAAEAAPTLAIQGRLATVGGGPVTDGTYALTLAFYASAAAPAALYFDIAPAVAVVDGHFEVQVGSSLPLDTAVFKSGQATFVGVRVAGEPELPRVPLGHVPYALRAESSADLACTACVGAAELEADALAPFATRAELAAVSFSGLYSDLIEPPKLVKLGQNCSGGGVVTGVDATGAVTCGTDKDTTYSGANFAVSGQGCGVGSVVTGIDVSGTLSCAADKDTTYSGANFALSNQACTTGSLVTGVSASGAVVCAVDKSQLYSGTDFATSNQACSPGSVVTGVSAAGAVECAADKDTTYSGTHFATSGQACGVGSVVTGISTAGAVQCAADKDTTYTGSTFATSNQGCSAGSVVTGINASGGVTCSTFGLAPLGAIVAFHKQLTGTPGLPTGWLECNGQTVSDPQSPFHNVAVPDLTGGRFLRGVGSSGGTGGSVSHTHSFTQTGADHAPDASNFTNGSLTDAANHLPPYFDVVWIIRVR